MRRIPHSFNGFLFQQVNRVASDFANPYDWDIQGITTSDLPRSQNFPLRVTKNYSGSIKVININLLDVDITRDEVVIAMDVLGAEQIQLISLDEYGRAWYVNADFIGLTEDNNSGKTASFGAVFAVDDPVWKKLIPSTQTIEVDGAIGVAYGTLTPIGNQAALPIIKITPTSAGSNTYGFNYQRFITVVNICPNAFNNYHVELTGSGLDTAALVTAGKMLSSGDDCRIYVDGVETKRWFGGGGFDAADTTIWVNLTMPAQGSNPTQGEFFTLGVYISDTGDVTEIPIENNADNIRIFSRIATTGKVLIGSEIFTYSSIDLVNLKLLGVIRAERQTVAAEHFAGDVVFQVPLDIWLYYGNPDIEAYVVDDTYKPLIDLTVSTNSHIVYDGVFSTLDGKRTGQWTKGINFPSLYANHYTATENTQADPAEVVGIWIESNAADYWWQLYNPCGFAEITSITGKKSTLAGYYRCDLFGSTNGVLFSHMIFVEHTPAIGGAWEALYDHTPVPVTLIDDFYLRLSLLNSSIENLNNGIEFDFASFDIEQPPYVVLAAEATNFNLHSVIYNYATDFSLVIDLSIPFLEYVIINTKEKTVVMYDGSNQINAILDFPIRAEWFPLLPSQDNEIQISESGNVTYEFSWEDRAL